MILRPFGKDCEENKGSYDLGDLSHLSSRRRWRLPSASSYWALRRVQMETCEPEKAETDRDGDEDGQHVHRRFRSALRETVSDESDMASAARKGVARPASATGTAMML